MNRKRILLALAFVLIVSAALFSGGCVRKVLYGTWQWTLTTYDGGSESPFFAMTFDVRSNGEIYLLDSLFATYKLNRNTYAVTYAKTEEGQEPETITGAWKLVTNSDGIYLYIYPDDADVMYTLTRVTGSSGT